MQKSVKETFLKVNFIVYGKIVQFDLTLLV